jgi:predicted transcriptional regulator
MTKMTLRDDMSRVFFNYTTLRIFLEFKRYGETRSITDIAKESESGEFSYIYKVCKLFRECGLIKYEDINGRSVNPELTPKGEKIQTELKKIFDQFENERKNKTE